MPSASPAITASEVERLPADFWLFADACGLATARLMTSGVISFHLVDAGLVGVAWIPVV